MKHEFSHFTIWKEFITLAGNNHKKEDYNVIKCGKNLYIDKRSIKNKLERIMAEVMCSDLSGLIPLAELETECQLTENQTRKIREESDGIRKISDIYFLIVPKAITYNHVITVENNDTYLDEYDLVFKITHKMNLCAYI